MRPIICLVAGRSVHPPSCYLPDQHEARKYDAEPTDPSSVSCRRGNSAWKRHALSRLAPGKNLISVVLCDAQKRSLAEFVMEPEEKGYFAAWVPEAEANSLYGFRLGDRPEVLPDPASRFQPQGPCGPCRPSIQGDSLGVTPIGGACLGKAR